MNYTPGPFSELTRDACAYVSEAEVNRKLAAAFPDKSETWRQGYKAAFFPWFFEPDPECRKELRAGHVHIIVCNPFEPPFDTDEKKQQYTDWLIGNATAWADKMISRNLSRA